jgi:F0F1-type ATP synthase epsilon subunit
MQGESLKILADSAVESTAIDASAAAGELSQANAKATQAGNTSAAARDRIERDQRIAAAKVAVTRR